MYHGELALSRLTIQNAELVCKTKRDFQKVPNFLLILAFGVPLSKTVRMADATFIISARPVHSRPSN